MLKKEMEQKLDEYKELLREVGRWVNPIQYGFDEMTPQKTLLFHLRGIRKAIDEKFYKLGD